MGTASPDPAPDAGATARARSAIGLVGLVVAPTTLVTALAFYFGWVQTNARSSYFGIDASTLGYTTQDYVLRSIDALYVPLGVLLVLALGAVFAHACAMRRLTDPRMRPAARAAVIAGALMFGLGVVAIFQPLSFSPPYLLATASPAIGITLIAYGRHLLARTRRGGPARSPGVVTALVVLVIVLSAFATISRYADALGRDRAARLSLDEQPRVTVFAPKDLAIAGPGIEAKRLTAEDGAYRHRYSGLRLLIRSDSRYFLLPEDWAPGRGAAIVLADDPGYRFEFAPGTGARAGRGQREGSSRAAASVARPVVPVMSPAPLGFEADVGGESERRVAVGGDGTARTLRGFSIQGDDAADFRVSAGTCTVGARLEAGKRCKLRIVFAPRARGLRSADLVVDLEPPSEDAGAVLSGAGR